jgi:hypothetical protein
LNGSTGRKLTWCFAFLTLALAGISQASAQRALRPGQLIDLKEQLITGLRPRLPSEFRYIDKVVDEVEAGQLPESLVRSTFVYARKKQPYPIQYFDRALRVRAKQRGIMGVPILTYPLLAQ